MRKIKIHGIIMAIFFFGLIGFLLKSSASTYRIFVLHSYDRDYSWTRDVDDMIKETLEKEKAICVKYHYMNTKKNSKDDQKKQAAKLAIDRINNWQPDILLAVDDNAQRWVGIAYVDAKKEDIKKLGVYTDVKKKINR